jgi:uncharacterized protein with HEPN domain
MSPRADDDCLRDILEALRRIKMYTNDMEYDRFLPDIKTQDAVARKLDVVWDIVAAELPALESQIEVILEQEQVGG